jgi:hypothetical protein
MKKHPKNKLSDEKKAACAKGGHKRWAGTTKSQRQAEAVRIRSFGSSGPRREEVGPVREFLKNGVRNALASKNPIFMARFPAGVAGVSIVREVVTLRPAPLRMAIPKNPGVSLLDRTKAHLASVGIE